MLRLKPLSTIDLLDDQPLAGPPKATRADFLALFDEVRAERHPVSEAIESEFAASIDRDWIDELALHTQIVIKSSMLNYQHGRVIYAVLRDRLLRLGDPDVNVCILETGTARGFSAVCMAKALSDAKQAGSIITLDILPHEKPMYWNCIDDLDGPKSRRALLSPWNGLLDRIAFVQDETRAFLPRVGLGRINFAFLDASHTYEDVMFEFHTIAARQEDGDVIVFDDVTASHFPGVVEAVEEIGHSHPYDVRQIVVSNQRGYAIAVRQAA
jgi:predicted O-methyltransferase YrrM